MDVLRHDEADKSWESYEAQNQSGRPVDQGRMGVLPLEMVEKSGKLGNAASAIHSTGQKMMPYLMMTRQRLTMRRNLSLKTTLPTSTMTMQVQL